MLVKESQKKIPEIYRRVTDIIKHGVVWIAENGQLLSVNSRFADDLGYENKKFTPTTIFEINPHLNLFTWKNNWKELLENKSITMNAQHISADGLIHPAVIKGVLIEADGAQVCCGVVESKYSDHRTRHLLEITSSITHSGSWQYDLVKNDWLFTDEVFLLLNIHGRGQRKDYSLPDYMKEVITPAEYKTLQKKLKDSIANGHRFSMEFGVPTYEGGEYRYLRLVGVPEQEDGETLSVYGMINDISKVSERTAELYLARYSLDYSAENIIWADRTGKIAYTNQAALELTGYPEKELSEMNIRNLVVDWEEEKMQDYFAETEDEGRTQIEIRMRDKRGKEFPAEIYANYISHEGKQYYCAFIRDLTEKKKNDRELRLSKFSLDNHVNPVYWINRDGKVRYANHGCTLLTGYTKKELQSMTIFDLTGMYPSTEAWEKRWQEMSGDGHAVYEAHNIRKDGSKVPVEVIRHYMKFDGEEILCVFLTDISKRKEKEEALTESLEETISQTKVLEKEVALLREDIRMDGGLGSIITNSDRYMQVLMQVMQVAETEATVLITGETGTGKELLAQAVHSLSRRAEYPLVRVNCAALPDNLFESELFGHERGAFTGAVRTKQGRFEIADGGTIFLDEIGEMPLPLQAKLLRVLQEGEFERIGGNKTFKVDVRIIAATNRELEEMVRKGTFREDLFYRLNVFPVHNLPLRERKEDIPVLVKHFMKKFIKKTGSNVVGISQAALKRLMQYEFPGNVRELENMTERAVILSRGKMLDIDSVLKEFNSRKKRGKDDFPTFENVQRDHILKALARTNGRITGENGAAKLLGMKDKTLYSKMTKLNINRGDYII